MYYDSIEEAIKAAPDCTHVLTTGGKWSCDKGLLGKFAPVIFTEHEGRDEYLCATDTSAHDGAVISEEHWVIALDRTTPHIIEHPKHLYGSMDDAIKAQPTCTHVLRRTTTQGYTDYVPVIGEYTSTTFKGLEHPYALEYDTKYTEWEVCGHNTATPTTEQRLAAARFDQAATERQVGGDHYKSLKIQPIEYIDANNLPYLEGNVVKYVTRHASKNGVQDIDKAIHYLELIKQMRYSTRGNS